MRTKLSLFLGKFIIYFSSVFHLGSGSTWPGHIALRLNRRLIKNILDNSDTKIILVAGTNGKTTTSRLITSIVRENNKTYLQNKAGANLVNGLASTVVNGASLSSVKLNKDYLIFEADEYALPEILRHAKPHYLVCLNLFRDQLDRYGEVDSIAKRWNEAFNTLLSDKTNLILNADDPQIAILGKDSSARSSYFGLDEKTDKNEPEKSADSTHCPICTSKLKFTNVQFSHIGNWSCTKCDNKRPRLDIKSIPTYPLVGTYNKYNALAAVLLAKNEKIDLKTSMNAFKSFTPAFGRQEKLKYKDRNIQIFLSKNPTSFNESLNTINELKAENLLIILNDRIPDGLDVSWIWDINFEDSLNNETNVAVAGDRVYDMSLRLKHSEIFTHVIPDPEEALDVMIGKIEKGKTLYILPNYSAMLDIRKVITGKKIL